MATETKRIDNGIALPRKRSISPTSPQARVHQYDCRRKMLAKQAVRPAKIDTTGRRHRRPICYCHATASLAAAAKRTSDDIDSDDEVDTRPMKIQAADRLLSHRMQNLSMLNEHVTADAPMMTSHASARLADYLRSNLTISSIPEPRLGEQDDDCIGDEESCDDVAAPTMELSILSQDVAHHIAKLSTSDHCRSTLAQFKPVDNSMALVLYRPPLKFFPHSDDDVIDSSKGETSSTCDMMDLL